MKLRSSDWFGREGKDGFIYRAWMKNQGIPDDEFRDKPVIGICNTWSELTPCNAHFRELAESVKKGVWESGGFPLEFPVMSLGETIVKPTAMLFRNLMSMTVEESIRANPLDGVVLLVGCDKTTPASVMGACSVDIPTIAVSGGPMLTGKFKGRDMATSDIWRMSEASRSGELDQETFRNAEAAMCRSQGHCAVMGTASTMGCMVESLGLTLPENAAIPAADSRRKVLAQLSGRRIVDMVKEDLKPSEILTREAFENAVIANAAIGGSTNFLIHLMAIAGRVGINLTLDDFDRLGSKIPLLANLQPSGKYFMEDFYYAGGLPAVMKELLPHLHKSVVSVNGKTVEENCSSAESFDEEIIAKLDKPFQENSGIAVVYGNLCENGAIIKPSAASEELMKHRGQAIVFETIEEFHERINDPELEADETNILVLKNVGPKGYPGMPEVGNMGLPPKLLKKGVKDMVRISDGRMSGTAFGTTFLHVSPESAIGGNLAFVQDGDWIEVDVENRRLHLDVPPDELEKRKRNWKPIDLGYDRGYVKMFIDHVEQADKGMDLDYLKGSSGSEVSRDSH
ncbi:IlvD/Edd family dehydratase [Membranihabitans maritimus]|uniref:IlvD/Edd family dehydratase n=1 Tax=Membranihabitans maritimus TaxID=2904244 RepID=UPI001F3852D0|nr:IlvD/Edd family dehydratase [Membranihabitans maritimus]